MTRWSALRFGAALIGALATNACSAPAPETLAIDEAPVLYGSLSTSEEDMVVEVVSKTDTVSHTCTGTLLSPNVVITARHCVSAYVDAPFTCTPDGELTPNSQGGKMGPLLEPNRITVSKGVKPTGIIAVATKVFGTQATTICRNDIAVLVLDTMLTDLPISSVRLGKGTSVSEKLRVVGYGVDENKMFGTRHTRSGLSISQVGSSQFRPVGDNVPPRTFVTEGPALCIGDSGGPAFSMATGAIIAVWSQVVGACDATTARNYFTEIAPFEDELITPAFAEAGGVPWVEGTTGPGGDPITGGAGAGGEGNTAEGGSSGIGEGGNVATGGASESGGATTGGAEASGGASSGGATSGRGGSPSAGGNAGGNGGMGGGLRKKGGCTCSTPGSGTQNGAAWLGAPLFAVGLLLRRARGRRSV